MSLPQGRALFTQEREVQSVAAQHWEQLQNANLVTLVMKSITRGQRTSIDFTNVELPASAFSSPQTFEAQVAMLEEEHCFGCDKSWYAISYR